MDNKSPVDKYQNRLDTINEQLLSRNREAEQRIKADQTEVLKILRDGVEAVQTLATARNLLERPSDTETDLIDLSNQRCATCNNILDGLYTECYDCETSQLDSKIAGRTFSCIKCQDNLPCTVNYHHQSLRHTDKPQWRLKSPLTGSKRLETSWVKCTLCGTVLPDLDSSFTWCIPCARNGIGTFCHNCTAQGRKCGVYGHPPPRSRLERVSPDSLSQSELVSTPDSGIGMELRAKTLQISEHFKRLVTVADKQIDTIMEANLEATSLEDRLDGLKLEIDGSVSLISSTIETTRRNLDKKNYELEVAQKKEIDLESQTATVDSRLEGNREDRKILRVFRVAGWGAAVAFPLIGLPLVAAMEVGNLELKGRRDTMETQRETLQDQCTNLESHATSIKAEKDRLDGILTRERAISSRCDRLTSRLKASKALLAAKQCDYHLLKVAATRFLSWSATVESRSGLLAVATDLEELEFTTRQVMKDLLMCKEQKIAEICGPLNRLLLESA